LTKLHLDDDFINKINQKYSRPFIQINAASSMDGKIAGLNGTRLEISPKEDFERVHELRSSLDSILVGIDTIINDDPRLMVKELFTDNRPLKHPTRLILDSKGRIDSGKRLFNSSTPTIIITSFDALNNLRDRFRSKGNVEIQGVHSNKSGLLEVEKLFPYLLEREIRSILVEGGSKVISYFIRNGLFDVLTIFISFFFIGGSDAPPLIGGKSASILKDTIRLGKPDIEILDEGLLISYTNL